MVGGSPRGAADEPEREERIADPQAIRALLRDAAQARSLCSVRPVGRPENYLGRMLGFDEARGTLSLEPPKAPYIERALAPGNEAQVDIKDGERRATFQSAVMSAGGGQSALVLALPDALVKPRRRESFRITVPPDVTVSLTLQPGGREHQLQNLSAQGVMVIVTGSLDTFEPGATFAAATFRFPDGRTFEVTLRVRHASAVRMAGQVGELRVGMAFVRTPAGFDAAVGHLVDTIARTAPRPAGA
jgi:c-di-GMP-binding flagellar brake protein YcgR